MIALTGGLGSGKTTVLRLFKNRGCLTIDSDIIVKRLLKKSAVLRRIRAIFGDKVFRRRSLDKQRLAEMIFRDARMRLSLENLLHPLVWIAMNRQLGSKHGHVAVCDIPLLYECGWNKYFDAVALVTASKTKRTERLRKRGMSPDQIKMRMRAQMPTAKKMGRADFVLNNNGSLAQTKKRFDRIYKIIYG